MRKLGRISRREPDWLSGKPSKLHNFGLFTSKLIKAGQEILFRLPKVTDEEYDKLRKVLGEKDLELFLETENYTYDIRKSVLRFLNHSDNPNTDFKDGLYLFALRDIGPGEEITIDYGWEEYQWIN